MTTVGQRKAGAAEFAVLSPSNCFLPQEFTSSLLLPFLEEKKMDKYWVQKNDGRKGLQHPSYLEQYEIAKFLLAQAASH